MEDKNTKPKISLAELQQLMALSQNAKTSQSKFKIWQQKALTKILPAIQKLVGNMDRLINFIVKPEDENRNDVAQAARAPILFGLSVIFVVVIVGGLWSATAPLNSAAVASGTLVPSSNRKIIQHREGGIVKAIYVKQGDHVKEGDKLIELDDSSPRSEYETVLSQYRTLLAAETRLITERDNLDKIIWPEFLINSQNIPEVAKTMHTQEKLFFFKKENARAETLNLKQKILQTEKKIESYEARKISSLKAYEINLDRLKSLKKLQAGGFASKAAAQELEGRTASAKSEVAGVEAEIISQQQEVTSLEIQLNNIQNKLMNQTLGELKEAQQQLFPAREKYLHLKDTLERIIVKSPVDGIVQELKVHTIGGVISQGATIMEISPINDTLVIEAQVLQKNIDSVRVGLKAKIKFSAFKSRTTPSFKGTVVSMSPDVVQLQPGDPRAGKSPEPFYTARIELDMDDFNKIAKPRHLELHSGMQVEVQIITGTRTLLRYLLDPVLDQMFKAFREK